MPEHASKLVPIQDLAAEVNAFAEQRDWLQYHSPKNLSMSIAIEAAELMERFQWSPDAAADQLDDAALAGVREELPDVLIYCLQLANVTGIDPAEAIRAKLAVNAGKYPVERARGSSQKYTELSP